MFWVCSKEEIWAESMSQSHANNDHALAHGMNNHNHDQQQQDDDGTAVMQSARSKASRSTRKRATPQSIEDIFNSSSSIQASDLSCPATKVVLTPRSAEVCLKLGVQPEALRIRDLDSFWAPNIDPAVQRLRHEAYVQRRHELMKACTTERRKLLRLEQSQQNKRQPKSSQATPEAIFEEQMQQGATLIELEKKRVEKMKLRQQKELEQMIQYEMHRAKMQEDMNQRMEEQKRREDIRRRQVEARARQKAEERRVRELQKLAEQDAEEQRNRALAQERFLREREMEKVRQEKLRQAKVEARRKEEEKQLRHAQQKQQVAAYYVQQQEQLRERLQTMEAVEDQKRKAVMERQLTLRQQLYDKRKAVEKRISKNLRMAEELEETRKQELLSRQAQHEEIRQQHMAEMESQRQLQMQQQQLQDHRRQMILSQLQHDEELTKEQLLGKFAADEEHVEQVRRERERAQALFAEKKKIREQVKAENVDRVKRMQEYKRLETLQKIKAGDERTAVMLRMRQELIDQRRRNAIETKAQKEAVTKMMEEFRSDATKAAQLMKKVLSSSDNSIASSSKSTRPAKRRQGKARGASAPQEGRRAAGSQDQGEGGFGRPLGPPPELPAHKSRTAGGLLSEQEQQQPMPYISPYDQ